MIDYLNALYISLSHYKLFESYECFRFLSFNRFPYMNFILSSISSRTESICVVSFGNFSLHYRNAIVCTLYEHRRNSSRAALLMSAGICPILITISCIFEFLTTLLFSNRFPRNLFHEFSRISSLASLVWFLHFSLCCIKSNISKACWTLKLILKCVIMQNLKISRAFFLI